MMIRKFSLLFCLIFINYSWTSETPSPVTKIFEVAVFEIPKDIVIGEIHFTDNQKAKLVMIGKHPKQNRLQKNWDELERLPELPLRVSLLEKNGPPKHAERMIKKNEKVFPFAVAYYLETHGGFVVQQRN